MPTSANIVDSTVAHSAVDMDDADFVVKVCKNNGNSLGFRHNDYSCFMSNSVS